MTHKHTLFFCGTYITVWGHPSREMTYKLFLEEICSQLATSMDIMSYAMQLSDLEDSVSDMKAYIAWAHIQYYIQNVIPIKWPITNQPVLKCDKIFSIPSSSSSSIVLSIPPATPKQEPTYLDRLTETLVSRRALQSAGTISKSSNMTMMPRSLSHIRSILKNMLQPQTIILVLGITAVFGFLAAPLH